MGLLVLFCLCLGCVGSSFGEKLYGAYDFGSGMVVAQYDSECSTTKNVSYFPDLFFAVGNKCAFDQDKGIMYSYAENSTAQKKFIYGISLTTGEILSTTSPPGNNLRAPQMAFDSNSGKIIFTADDSNGFWQQYLVNPRTGRGQNVNSVNGTNYSPFLGAGSGFDPVNSIQWIPAADLTMGTSNQLGLGLDGSIYLVLDQNSGSTPVYSGDSAGTMYAWGYTGKRVTESWTFSDNQTTLLTQVQSSWDIDFNGVNAYSTETDTLYSVLDNGDPDVDYFLVGVDVNTGATKSAVFLNEAVWPWCLGYVNDV